MKISGANLLRDRMLVAMVAVFGAFRPDAMAATISPQDTPKYIGHMEEVRGVVTQVGHARSGVIFFGLWGAISQRDIHRRDLQ
jgi:hypothetical protein